MSGIKGRVIAGAIASAAVIAMMSGCGSTASPEEQVIAECEQELQYAIEQSIPQPKVGWLDAELETSDMRATVHPDGGQAFNVRGGATITLNDGSTEYVTFDCFGQIADGNPSASVNKINGSCTPKAEEDGNPNC